MLWGPVLHCTALGQGEAPYPSASPPCPHPVPPCCCCVCACVQDMFENAMGLFMTVLGPDAGLVTDLQHRLHELQGYTGK